MDGLGVDPDQASRLRAAAQAVDAARADGLPQAIETGPARDRALVAADERPAIEAVQVRELPELYRASTDDIVEAEIVETSREDRR